MPDLSEFARKPVHPKGFEPGLQWDGTKGTLTTGPMSEEPDPEVWDQLISDWGLDPSRTRVVDGSLQIRAWDSSRDGQPVRMKYYRCTIAPREATVDRADIDELCRRAMKRGAPTRKEPGDGAFLVLLSDWQLGKARERYGGTPETVERIEYALGASLARARKLKPSCVYLVGLGDLVESCMGHYEMQTFSVDLSDREQDKLARRLILKFVDEFLSLGVPMVCMGVPGNHGENRRNGKAFTDFKDNRDYAVFEQVAEICAANPERYGHVSFPTEALNDDDLTLTLDLQGVPVTFAHGHQFTKGANAQAKAETWLTGQALGRHGPSDAQILVSGHLHHFAMSEATGRTMLQVPAMDGGSRWFQATNGASAPSGMVTLMVGARFLRGWSHLMIV